MHPLARLKLCFLAGTLEHGGAERQLFYMLQALCRLGAKPRLLSLDRGGFWEKAIAALGVSVEWVGRHPSRLQRLLRVWKEIRKDAPDLVQSQHFFANAYAGVAARLAGITGIGAMRNDGRSEVRGSGPLGGWLNLNAPRVIAANSRQAIRYATDHGFPEGRLYFLPNVVDTEQFQPAHEPKREPLTLVTVGRLVRQKRLDRFLAVLAHLRKDRRLNVRGLIVGPGCREEDLGPELEDQARRLGLFPDGVRFQGGVSDTRAVYREAAVCVLTSDHEGTPNVLLEAMACGLPVVASNVGGVPGVILHGLTGYLVGPDHRSGFAAALVELVTNPALRAEMGRRARAYVEEHHACNRLPTYLSGLYEFARPTPRPATNLLGKRMVQPRPEAPGRV